MKAWFITSSGTEIGKTLVTCALAHHLHTVGKKVIVRKPIVTGWEEAPEKIQASDTGLLLAATGQSITDEAIYSTSPWRFTAPLSPHIAARYERREIDPKAVVAHSTSDQKNLKENEYLLVEGVGGAMVPLTSSYHSLDWMQALGFPVILVVGDYLGAISHTLTTLEALNAYRISVHAIVVSGSSSPPMPIDEMLKTLESFTSIPIAGLPFITNKEKMPKYLEASDNLKTLFSKIMV